MAAPPSTTLLHFALESSTRKVPETPEESYPGTVLYSHSNATMGSHDGTVFHEHLSLLWPTSCYFTRVGEIDTRGISNSDDSSPMMLLEIHPNVGSLLVMNWYVKYCSSRYHMLPSLQIREKIKSLFGKNGTVPFGGRFYCEKSLLSVWKRKESHLYRDGTEQLYPNRLQVFWSNLCIVERVAVRSALTCVQVRASKRYGTKCTPS